MLRLEIQCGFNDKILSDVCNENEVGVYKDVASVSFAILHADFLSVTVVFR